MSTTQFDSPSAFHETIDQAKNSYLDAKRRLMHAFATTPDDRVDWSPSPTSRTPAQIVGHAAASVKNLAQTMKGNRFAAENPEVAEIQFRKDEEEMVGREKVMADLEDNSQEYLAWLDALTPETLESMVDMPFSFGFFPMKTVITFPYLHMMGHVPQIEYIQTIYGDRDWHLQ